MTPRRVLLVALLALTLLGGGRAGAQENPTAPAPAAADETNPDALGVVLFPDQVGTHPDAAYELYYGNSDLRVDAPNAPGPLDDIAKAAAGALGVPTSVQTPVPTDRSVTGWFLAKAFNFTRDVASLAWQMVGWLYSFGFIRLLTPLVETFSSVLDQGVVGPLGLRSIVGLILGGVLALRLLLTHKFASTIAEIVVAVVLFTGSWLLVAHPAAYFNAVADVASQAAQLPFRAINYAHPAASPDEGRIQAEVGMKRAFVELPWQVLNYGHELHGACAAAGDRVLAAGPFSVNAEQPRTEMLKVGCKQEALYNNDPTGARMWMAFFIAVGVIAAALFVFACIWAFLRAEFGLAWGFATGSIRLLLGSSEYTREMAVTWAKSLADDVVGMIVPAWTLAFMVIADLALLGLGDAVTANPASNTVVTAAGHAPYVPILLRLMLMAVLNWAVFTKRKVIVNKAARFLSGNINKATAKVMRAERAEVRGAARDNQASSARDFMPNHKLVTVPLVAAGVAVGRQAATGGEKVRKVRSVAADVAGPVGEAVKATSAGAAATASRAKSGMQDVSSQATDTARRASARMASRGAGQYPQQSRMDVSAMSAADLNRVGPEHGPTRADIAKVDPLDIGADAAA